MMGFWAAQQPTCCDRFCEISTQCYGVDSYNFSYLFSLASLCLFEIPAACFLWLWCCLLNETRCSKVIACIILGLVFGFTFCFVFECIKFVECCIWQLFRIHTCFVCSSYNSTCNLIPF